jgi:hypothetical protein
MIESLGKSDAPLDGETRNHAVQRTLAPNGTA